MSYFVKELFYTLQGEGLHSGTASVFLRFAGCNLWSGREQDRDKGKGGCARWCDTEFVGTDGVGGGRFETANSLAESARAVWDAAVASRTDEPHSNTTPYVVCTGGEPALQLDHELVAALHAQQFYIAIETNGTLPLPEGIDHVCLSPKAGAPVVITKADVIKLVYPQPEAEMSPEHWERLASSPDFANGPFGRWFLQPLDNITKQKNIRACVEYCLKHPRWRLSLQTHKLLGIP